MDKPTRSDAAAVLGARIPIAIGVVGHTDPALDTERELASAVRNLVERIHSRYKHSPIEVVSRLAEGSDQIAVDVAIKKKWSVRVPLPFPRDIYAESDSFHSGAAKDPPRNLLDNDLVSSFVTPVPNGPEPGDDAAWIHLRDDPIDRAVATRARDCTSPATVWS